MGEEQGWTGVEEELGENAPGVLGADADPGGEPAPLAGGELRAAAPLRLSTAAATAAAVALELALDDWPRSEEPFSRELDAPELDPFSSDETGYWSVLVRAVEEQAVRWGQRAPVGRRRVALGRQGIAAGWCDRAAGQVAVQHLRVTDQHLQHVVQDIAGAGTALCQVELGQVELALAEAQEYYHLVAAPDARVGVKLRRELCLQVGQRARRCWRVAPQQLRVPQP
uniref:Uncharacterized protein n=1 Tax=Anopheles atroparvus TaxID=41427 RepID=A0A182JJX6_ANOAO